MIVSRGPQLVQLRKGYRYRRSRGSNSSRTQSAQGATSGERKIGPSESTSLGSIRKRGSPLGDRGAQRISSIRASGGGRVVSSARNRSRERDSPSTSIRTSPVWFLTKPLRPRRVARSKMKGRKPTP